MAIPDVQVLAEAIARRAPAVLSLPLGASVEHNKTRFLLENSEGFWMLCEPRHRAQIDRLIAEALPAGISFRGGVHRVAFTAPLLKRDEALRVDETTFLEAVLVGFPADLHQIQRRHSFRVSIPQDSDLQVRVWRVDGPGPIRDRPVASNEIAVWARNVSSGGIGLRVKARSGDLPSLSAGDRLRVMLMYRSTELVVEGRIRHQPSVSGSDCNLGVQFVIHDDKLEGRQAHAKLTGIIGEMQREQARRTKLGLTG